MHYNKQSRTERINISVIPLYNENMIADDRLELQEAVAVCTWTLPLAQRGAEMGSLLEDFNKIA